jgi:hypothetical protein
MVNSLHKYNNKKKEVSNFVVTQIITSPSLYNPV